MAGKDQDHEIKLREPNPEALNDPELVNSVAGMLSELTGTPADEIGEVDETPRRRKNPLKKEEDEPIDEPEVQDDDDEVETTDDSTLEDDATEEGEDEVEREIPEAYYRSAVHSGWSEDEVNELYDMDPTKAMSLLQNLHQRDNNLTAQFSEMGRRAKAFEQQDQSAQNTAEKPNASSPDDELDLESLREKYGDDPIVGVVAKQATSLQQMNDMLTDLKKQLENTRHDVSAQQTEADRQAEKAINDFFGGMKHNALVKFYGAMGENDTDWTGLSTAQRINRNAVCQMAGEILDGSRFHGRNMSLEEALERAHSSVSEPIAEQVVRQKIMGEVEKRHKSRVVRPSQSKKKGSTEPNYTGKPRNRQEIEERAHERLAALNLMR